MSWTSSAINTMNPYVAHLFIPYSTHVERYCVHMLYIWSHMRATWIPYWTTIMEHIATPHMGSQYVHRMHPIRYTHWTILYAYGMHMEYLCPHMDATWTPYWQTILYTSVHSIWVAHMHTICMLYGTHMISYGYHMGTI